MHRCRRHRLDCLALLTLVAVAPLLSSRASAATYYWDTTPGAMTGGDGAWSTAGTDWSLSSTGDASLAAWPGGGNIADFYANYSGSAGSIAVSGNVAANAITFDGAGYLLSGGAISLGGGGVVANQAAMINSTIQGNSGLLKTGTGALTLGGSNVYVGGTTISGGMLRVGASNALPIAGTVTLGGLNTAGTLDLAGNNQQVAGLAVAPAANPAGQIIGNSSTTGNATITFSGSGQPQTFNGTIQDALGGGNKKVGLAVSSGVLILGGSNTYTGG
ncbi:MAG: autotransporter-associated beta strand repeat-containing protein, partial [Thermoguttaceae bacterium]